MLKFSAPERGTYYNAGWGKEIREAFIDRDVAYNLALMDAVGDDEVAADVRGWWKYDNDSGALILSTEAVTARFFRIMRYDTLEWVCETQEYAGRTIDGSNQYYWKYAIGMPGLLTPEIVNRICAELV